MPKKFIFQNNQNIGAAQAELDSHYLTESFIDTGDLEILTNCEDPRRVIAGRTGAGKSALIAKIQEQEENVILIRPEALALTYISNSGVIGFFSEVGVKMDIFYRLLWRHIFVVEILKYRFHLTEDSNAGFLNALFQLVPRKRQHELALDYLKKWGESFWKETEYRVREVTSKLEKEMVGSMSANIPNIGSLNTSAARKLTEEQREEVVHRAQEVVNKVQIADLSRVIDLLDEVLLKDPQKKYYIIIDKLDEDWVEDRLRFRLIRALLETTLDFGHVKNLKIILAIRNDLLDRVYRYTRDAGFQEEKYRSITLQIRWNRNQLTQLLDARISQLVREQYTNYTVTHEDILPEKMGKKKKTIDYMLDRTLLRPRDIIQFFNACIREADGTTFINQNAFKQAEGIYSRERLRALADEWYGLYPNLLHLTEILKRREETFLITSFADKQLTDNYLELLVSGKGENGLDLDLMKMGFEDKMSIEDYRINVILIFHKVGLIGIKTDSFSRFSWSDSGNISVSSAEIFPESKISIHPMFWRCLGIDYKDEDNPN